MKNQKLLKNLKCRGSLLALLLTLVASLFTYTSAWADYGFWTLNAFNVMWKEGTTEHWGSDADGYNEGDNINIGVISDNTKLDGFWVNTYAKDGSSVKWIQIKYSKDKSSWGEYSFGSDGSYTCKTGDPYTFNSKDRGVSMGVNLKNQAVNNPGNNTLYIYFNVQDCNSNQKSSGQSTLSFTLPGFSPATASQTDFSCTAGSTQDKEISFTHYGTTLTEGDCSLTTGTDFEVSSISESGVTVTFKPTTSGTKDDELTITKDGKTCTITLKGEAAAAGSAPTVLIADAPSVSGSVGTLFGYLKFTGCQNVTDYGFIWSTTQSDIEGTTPSGGTTIKATYPTGDITVGHEGTEFKAEDKEFDPQTTIYYRAYATNTIGTSYSDEIRSFSTAGCIKPVVTDIDVPDLICSNAGTITATATATAGSIFAWDVDGTVFTEASGTTATATITVGAAGTGSITVTPTKEGCVGNPFTLRDKTVKDATITAKNLKVDGDNTDEGATIDFCEGQEITFKITSDYDVETYTWSFPTGWTITLGEGTKEVKVTASATSGTVSATIANDCGESDTRTIEASVTAKPATPGDISGATSVCKGTPQTYSVEAVSGATGYDWILPTGWTGTCDPEGGNTIIATPGADAESGTIKVKATNDCGSSEYNTGIEVTVGGYAIAISGVGAKSAAATYPWEYMTLTATTDATNITWNCVYSGTVAADLTVFETNGKTAKLKSGADASDTEHYTVTASSTDGGCQTTSPGYDVYINAADPEICD